MKWQLQEAQSSAIHRTYIHEDTGSISVMDMIYTDKDGRKWWGFRDLFAIPYMRIVMSKQLADLFQVGITAQDLRDLFNRSKGLLKPANGVHDPEKYEKLYALLLEKEVLMESAVDPLKQYLTLATVYVCSDDEVIDIFTHDKVELKLKLWSDDQEMSAFFLNWYAGRIAAFTTDYSKFSQIASNLDRVE